MLWFYMVYKFIRQIRIIIQQNGEELYFMYNEKNQPFWPGWTAKRELLDRYDSKEFTN